MRVNEIMSKSVKTVTSTSSAEAAWQVMKGDGIHHLVVKDGARISGVLTSEDAGGARGGAMRENLRVGDLMTTRVVTVPPTATVKRAAGMMRLKLYLMIGLPGETDADIDECAEFVSKLSRILPVALGIAPFCAKRRTPLDGQPFAGIEVVQARLERLRRGLKGRADVRSTSAKWAWVEYVLAQGAEDEGLALWQAVQGGGRFSDYRRAFAELGYSTRGPQSPRLEPPPQLPLVSAKPQRTSPPGSRALPLVG